LAGTNGDEFFVESRKKSIKKKKIKVVDVKIKRTREENCIEVNE
jgi:hypothetical protein